MESRTPSGDFSRHHQTQQQQHELKQQEKPNDEACVLDFKSDSADVLKGPDVPGTLVQRNLPVAEKEEKRVTESTFVTECTTISPCTVPLTSSGYYSGGSNAETDNDDGNDDNDVEKEPRNFSWVLDGLLCACAFPHTQAHFRYLANRGVTRIVSLTAERDLDEKLAKDFEVIRLGVQDFTPPTLDQIDRFVEVVQQAEAERSRVAVHCAAGKGRTGTAVACFLVQRFRLTDQQAIRDVRSLRPGSVETSEQEATVRRCHDRLLRDSPAEGVLVVHNDELFRRYREKLRLQAIGADDPDRS